MRRMRKEDTREYSMTLFCSSVVVFTFSDHFTQAEAQTASTRGGLASAAAGAA